MQLSVIHLGRGEAKDRPPESGRGIVLEHIREHAGAAGMAPAGPYAPFDFYGHQVVAHLAPNECGHTQTSAVDEHQVPVRHFGAVLSIPQWEALADKLRRAGTQFIIEPYIRFKGEVGEQATMFFLDPSGNAIEFKAFRNMESLFAK